VRKVFVIARREYQATVKTKAFIVSLVLMPIFMLGGLLMQRLLKGVVNVDTRRIVVLDGTGVLAPRLIAAANARNEHAIFDPETKKQIESRYEIERGPDGEVTDDLRLALSDRVRKHEIFAFVEIPASVLAPRAADGTPTAAEPVRYYAENLTQFELQRWIANQLTQFVHSARLQEVGLDPAVVAYATAPVGLDTRGLFQKSAAGEIKKASPANREAALFVPMVVMFLMFMVVMTAAAPLLQSVLEEKQQRIAEVLLGSCNPFQIMLGKLLGNVGVSITIVAVYMLGGMLFMRQYGALDMIPRHMLGWFVLFQVLAVLLYGSIFVAIGAACTEQKEAQSFMTPVMLILVVPMMVWIWIIQDPLGSFSTWVSLIPPFTPLMMVTRMAATNTVPMWQPALGAVLVLVAMLICVWAAGRVLRIGLLSQGKAPKFAELMRWIITG